MNVHSSVPAKLVPFSLKDAPSFIESQLPVGRVSAECYKERKAGAGQTLTALGSYWKGRKPLVLVRAALLGCLLPATNDPVADLHVFLLLMGMDDTSFIRRFKSAKPSDVTSDFGRYKDLIDVDSLGPSQPKWRHDISKSTRITLIGEWLDGLPYDRRLSYCLRPEEVEGGLVSKSDWQTINNHLGTSAATVPELVEQLGIMRYGHRPRVADTFAGGGSIPFEAARSGCDVYASDLNPIACMLTWGAFNIVGKSEKHEHIKKAQIKVDAAVSAKIETLGIEKDKDGNRAKAFLYCVEVVCPKTGWLVPLSPSWVVSTTHNAVARLIPIPTEKRYAIEIVSGVTLEERKAAEVGTLRGGRVVHPMNPDREGVAISVIRGDHKTLTGQGANNIRPWELHDFTPRAGDVFQERLYAVQWIGTGQSEGRTFFRSVTDEDLLREQLVNNHVAENLDEWQRMGLVPDAPIVTGDETARLKRERGWTHWHHLFGPRDLFRLHLIRQETQSHPELALDLCSILDFMSKLTQWIVRYKGKGGSEFTSHVFSNQALNTFFNWGNRGWIALDYQTKYKSAPVYGKYTIRTHSALDLNETADIFLTDPPYADAVNYHEITEFFIAWLRKNPPVEFADWTWDSQRNHAIKGSDEKFRSDMVAAYRNMAAHMPDNGLQVVMFTHQDAGVWADLASVMWAAGLRVTAAWNIVTETDNALKEGNYVQGTILLVLRKRLHAENIKRMDIEGEIEDAVDHQLSALHDLDEDWTSERLYTDGDLQLAAYAAALRVITGYATIDRKEVGADVYRKLAKGEKTVIRELIEYAASVANNKLVPEGFPPAMWRDLDAPSRFYVRMLDMESKGTTKFADYQDFARTFSVADYAHLMDSTKANAASLAGAGALKARMLGGNGFGTSPLRRVLFATHKTMQKDDPREGLAFLKMELGQDYWVNRAKLVAIAKYVSAKTVRTRPVESSAADLLGQRLEVDKV